MRRPISLGSEVVGCGDDALTKKVLPETIHHDPGRQRILRVGDPVCQFQTAASLRDVPERLLGIPRQHHGKPPGHQRAFFLRLAVHEQEDVAAFFPSCAAGMPTPGSARKGVSVAFRINCARP